MKDADFVSTQVQVLMVAGLAADLDVAGFLDRIAHAHSIGPIVDPTRYRDRLDELRALEDIGKAVKAVQEATKRHLVTLNKASKAAIDSALPGCTTFGG